MGDDRVRPEHEAMDGMIFEHGDSDPGEAPGCRCDMEELPVEIEIESENKMFTEVKMISLRTSISHRQIRFIKRELEDMIYLVKELSFANYHISFRI